MSEMLQEAHQSELKEKKRKVKQKNEYALENDKMINVTQDKP